MPIMESALENYVGEILAILSQGHVSNKTQNPGAWVTKNFSC